jgi:Domain of unknown function (DUF1911)/Domain of unknown function (DUF1910)
MHKRSVFKEQDYFNTCLVISEKQLDEVAEDIDSILSGDVTVPVSGFRKKKFRMALQYWVLSYSAGDDLPGLREKFSIVTGAYADLLIDEKEISKIDLKIFDEYIEIVWFLSIRLLLEVADNELVILSGKLNVSGIDYIVDCLLFGLDKGVTHARNVLYPSQYGLIAEWLRNESAATPNIPDFLKSYYAGMKDAYWYNTHLNEKNYFGYWCFELAATVKLLHIDDTLFANSIFYPRDLTGKKLFRTWEDSPEGEKDRNEYKAMCNKTG